MATNTFYQQINEGETGSDNEDTEVQSNFHEIASFCWQSDVVWCQFNCGKKMFLLFPGETLVVIPNCFLLEFQIEPVIEFVKYCCYTFFFWYDIGNKKTFSLLHLFYHCLQSLLNQIDIVTARNMVG